MASEQLVVFQLGNEEYAVSIARVKEITSYGGSTKLPNTPEHMEGIINLRGKVIPVIDLAKRFGLIRQKIDGVQAIIVEAAGQDVGVIVDGVTEVVRLEDSDVEPAPILAGGGYIRGIGKAGTRLLILLDVGKLFDQEEMRQLKNIG